MLVLYYIFFNVSIAFSQILKIFACIGLSFQKLSGVYLLAVLPETLQIIKLACLGIENMENDIYIVKHNPV